MLAFSQPNRPFQAVHNEKLRPFALGRRLLKITLIGGKQSLTEYAASALREKGFEVTGPLQQAPEAAADHKAAVILAGTLGRWGEPPGRDVLCKLLEACTDFPRVIRIHLHPRTHL